MRRFKMDLLLYNSWSTYNGARLYTSPFTLSVIVSFQPYSILFCILHSYTCQIWMMLDFYESSDFLRSSSILLLWERGSNCLKEAYDLVPLCVKFLSQEMEADWCCTLDQNVSKRISKVQKKVKK